MKNTALIFTVAALFAGAGIALAGGGFNAPIYASFVGQSYSYTNTTGNTVGLSAIAVSGTFSNAPNATITLTQNSQAIELANEAATTSLTVLDDAAAIRVERNGVVSVSVPSTATATNRVYIQTIEK